ncbi:hypothetical protein ZWY2020_060074 [Hordeum vulgare]|nr:hypothetical protein ZWY2020_060074 [Hordeum vulgare]
MMGITKQKFGNEHKMSINEFSHYSLFCGSFLCIHLQQETTTSVWCSTCILVHSSSFLGLSFRHIPNNLSNYNVLTANAPFFIKSQGHGLIMRVVFYHGVGSQVFMDSFFNSILSLQQKSGVAPQLYTPFVRRTLVHYELRSESKRPFNGPTLFNAPLDPVLKMSFALLGGGPSRGSRKGKRTNLLLHLARDEKERASSIDEQHIDGALGIALFISPFLLASSNPFVQNFFIRTDPLAESNPVPQDPISAIHPPCIYAGDVASAMGLGYDAAEKNGTLLRSAGCVGSHIRSSLFTRSFKHFVGGAPALLLRRNRSLLMLLRRCFFAFSSLWTGALMDTVREQAKRVVCNGKKDTTTSPLSWTAGANTVVSGQDQVPIRIWILTCRLFLTVGISPGSWWAHHELGRGGWWFRDTVENASFMPRVLDTARIHSVILPLLHSWTSLLNILTLPCCVLGIFSIRSGLLALVHSSATDDTRGRFLWWFFLLITGISMTLFYQMKRRHRSVEPIKKRWLWREVLLCTYITRLTSNPAPLCYVMEEFSFLLGWLFSASNWLPDFVPSVALGKSLWRGAAGYF